MPTCNRCEKKFGLSFAGGRGLCPDCHKIVQKELAERRFIESGGAINTEAPAHILDEQAAAIIVTTTTDIPGFQVAEIIKIVGAEAAIGMNLLQDAVNTLIDVIGGRSATIQATLRQARETCLVTLKREALFAGAEAVIGVKFDYSQASTSAGGILFVVATGTAVKLG
jgi:uncharacterized protein YbjQ (UPF0145 family)